MADPFAPPDPLSPSDPFSSPDPLSHSDPFARPAQGAAQRAEDPFAPAPVRPPSVEQASVSEDLGGIFETAAEGDSPFQESTPVPSRGEVSVFAPSPETPPAPGADVFSRQSPFSSGMPEQTFGAASNEQPAAYGGPQGGGALPPLGAAQPFGGTPNYPASQPYAASSGYAANPGYTASPTFPPGPGYATTQQGRQGMSAGKVLAIVMICIVGIVLAIVLLVSGVFRTAGLTEPRSVNSSTAAPIVDGNGASASGAPEGISMTPAGQHFHNGALGLDADLPKEWVKKDMANAIMYEGGVGGCSVIVVQKESFVPASTYNASLHKVLEKDMPGIVFGTAPAWAGPLQPSDTLEGTSTTDSGVPVTQNYSHFYRGRRLVSVIETRKVSDDRCQTELEAFEGSFRLK